MDVSDMSPLPHDFEAAIKEVKALRNMLRMERMVLAKAIEKRALDNKAHAGNIRGAKEQFLRTLLDLLKTRKTVLFGGPEHKASVPEATMRIRDMKEGYEAALEELRGVRT